MAGPEYLLLKQPILSDLMEARLALEEYRQGRLRSFGNLQNVTTSLLDGATSLMARMQR